MDRKEARPAATGSSSFSTNTLQLRFNVSIYIYIFTRVIFRVGEETRGRKGGEGWRTNICLRLTGLMMVGRVEEFIARLGCTTMSRQKETRITRLGIQACPIR